MIGEFLGRILEGLLQPRKSARRILAAEPKMDTAIMMLLLAYLVQAIIQLAMLGMPEMPEGVSRLGVHLSGIVMQMLMAAILWAMVFGIGRMFGGTGTGLQSIVMVAWHTLVTAFLLPVFILGLPELMAGEQVSGLLLFLMLGAIGFWMWLLACYTAELHGFRNPWGAMGMMLAVSFLFAMLLLNMVPAA